MQMQGEGPVRWRSCSSDEIAFFPFGGFCPSVLSPHTGNFNHVHGFTSAFLFVWLCFSPVPPFELHEPSRTAAYTRHSWKILPVLNSNYHSSN